MTDTLTIGDSSASVDLDPTTGGIVALRDQRGDCWAETSRPALFVLEVPRHGDRTVVVDTAQQHVTTVAVADDGAGVELAWHELRTSTGETVAGRVRARLGFDGTGALRAELDVDTDAAETVRFPVLRGVRPARGNTLDWRAVDYSQGTRVQLLPHFDSNSPYWGTVFPDYASVNLRPEVMCNPTSPLLTLAGSDGGITVLPSEPTLEVIGWRTALEPGYTDSLSRSAGASTVTVEAIHLSAAAGGVRPMTISVYAGRWRRGLDAYRRTQHPSRRPGAAWLAEPRSWLQVQVMSTEGEPRYTFDDLIGVIDECAEAGIGAIQIVGWNEGGQDGLVPVHTPATKLGGEAGLRRVLTHARERDVRAVLYVKYQWVERPGPWWDQLEPYACRDENGQTYAQPGPVYHSSRKRYGISTPSYVPLCFAVPQLREQFSAEVRQMAEWGAAGVLADESLYHGRSLLCFSADHGHPAGASSYLWDNVFVDELRAAAAAVTDEFVIAGEGCYDHQFTQYDLSYFRSSNAAHVPAGRLLRPGVRIVTALTGFDDRNMVNQCLLYGYAMSFEPYNFKGRPGDMPLTVAYGTAVDRLRRQYAPWLWDGVIDESGTVRVVDENGAEHPYVTHWQRGDAHPGDAAVIVNIDDVPRQLRLHASGALFTGLITVPDAEQVKVGTDGWFTVAPRSAVLATPAHEASTSKGAAMRTALR